MRIELSKEREELGKVLINMHHLDRANLKRKLTQLGVTQGEWQGYLTYAKAYDLPSFVRDVIVAELPETENLFVRPLKGELV